MALRKAAGCGLSRGIPCRSWAVGRKDTDVLVFDRSLRPTAHGRQRIPRELKSSLPRGFTLIEVLAALVIVSLGMLGVIEAVSQTASNGAYLRDKAMAHWVAMNQLTKVRLETRAPKIDKSSDEVDMGLRRWRWTMTVTQTPVETVRRIDINVAPAQADAKTSLASVTGFYGAAIAPGVQPVAWGSQGPPGGIGKPDDEAAQPRNLVDPAPEPPPPNPDEETDPGGIE